MTETSAVVLLLKCVCCNSLTTPAANLWIFPLHIVHPWPKSTPGKAGGMARKAGVFYLDIKKCPCVFLGLSFYLCHENQALFNTWRKQKRDKNILNAAEFQEFSTEYFNLRSWACSQQAQWNCSHGLHCTIVFPPSRNLSPESRISMQEMFPTSMVPLFPLCNKGNLWDSAV